MADMSQRLALNVAEVSSVGGRASNQDAIGRAERGELACFVVSDGAGGHEGGEVAARTVVQSVLSTFGDKPGFSADATPAMVAEAAIAVTDLAIKVCGGSAFRKELAIERHFRDARAARVMAPTTDALLDFVGRSLLGLPLLDEAVP